MAADLMPKSQDPSLPALLLAFGGIAIGFGAILLAWVGASRQPLTAAALPWLISGGLGGVATIGLSVTVAAVVRRRRALAEEVLLLDTATDIARGLRRRS